MHPDFCSTIRSPKMRQARKSPSELHSMTRAHSSAEYLSKAPVDVVTALLNRISSRVHCDLISSASFLIESSLLKSSGRACASRPDSLRVPATSSHLHKFREAINTAAPASPRACEI